MTPISQFDAYEYGDRFIFQRMWGSRDIVYTFTYFEGTRMPWRQCKQMGESHRFLSSAIFPGGLLLGQWSP